MHTLNIDEPSLHVRARCVNVVIYFNDKVAEEAGRFLQGFGAWLGDTPPAPQVVMPGRIMIASLRS